MSALLAPPARIQQQLLAAAPGTRLTFGDVSVSVHAYGFEAHGALTREWCYGDAMARTGIAARIADAITSGAQQRVLAPAS